MLPVLLMPIGVQAHDAAVAGVVLSDVVVTDSSHNEFRVEQRHVHVGALGERTSLTTPYAVSAVASGQMMDTHAHSVQDALRFMPWVQADTVRPQTRGIQGSVIQNSRVDGFNMVSTTDYPAEQFERIEVINGVAGSLYGPAMGAGLFSFEQKRAAREGISSLRLGIDSHAMPSVHADLWTALTPDRRWRLRLNLLQESGASYAQGSHRRRIYGGLALDADLTSETQWQINASDDRFVRRGEAGSFGVAANVAFPAAVDPERVGYGQPYAGNDNETSMVSTRIMHRLPSGWQLVAGLLRQIADRQSTGVTNTLRSLSGNYVTTTSQTTASRFTVTGNQLSVRGRVQAWGARHDVLLGNNGFDWNNYNPRDGRTMTLGQATLAAPVLYPEPVWPDFRKYYQSAAQRQQSLMFADVMEWDPHWQVMLGASYSWMKLVSYNRTGAVTRRSSDHGASPHVSVMYHPDPVDSVYVSYGDTLQPGDAAPVGTANAGEVLDPYRSRQWELGYKTQRQAFDASLALFRIVRPFAFSDSTALVNGLPLFRESGRQRNHGVEGMLSGHVTPDLDMTLMLSYLDPRIVSSGNVMSRDRQIVGLSRWSTSLQADMRVRAVRGLSVNARFLALNRRAGNYANTYWIGGYGRLDLGARWHKTLSGHDTVWCLTINNVTNKRYWTNIVAGGLNGYSGTGNATAATGDPREAIMTVQIAF